MDFHDALRVLDIDEKASASEVRLAYLRRLRRHRPEHDPEGFRRLREAYELVRAVLDDEEQVALPLAVPTFVAPAEIEPLEGQEQRRSYQTEQTERVQGESGQAPTDSVATESGSHVDTNSSAVPHATFLRWFMPQVERDPLRQTADDSASNWDEPDRNWNLQDADLVARLRSFPSALAGVEVAVALVEGGEPYRAAQLTSLVISRASEDMTFGPVPVPSVVDIIVRLYASEHARAGHILFEAFAAWLADTGSELQAFNEESIATWVLVQELHEVAPDLPARVRCIVAGGIRDHNLERTTEELLQLNHRSAQETAKGLGILSAGAPRLFDQVWPMADESERSDFTPPDADRSSPIAIRRPAWAVWGCLVLVAMIPGLIRNCSELSAKLGLRQDSTDGRREIEVRWAPRAGCRSFRHCLEANLTSARMEACRANMTVELQLAARLRVQAYSVLAQRVLERVDATNNPQKKWAALQFGYSAFCALNDSGTYPAGQGADKDDKRYRAPTPETAPRPPRPR